MLTRCPSCATHFRVTPEQLKARSGRVRCGQCQNVFNALDSLIEEPVVVAAPMAAVAVPPAPTFEEMSASATVGATPSAYDSAAEAGSESQRDEVTELAQPRFEPQPEHAETHAAALPESREAPNPDLLEETATRPAEPDTETPGAEPLSTAAPAVAETDAPAAETTEEWTAAFPEPPTSPRRWPWVAGSLVALVALVLQAALAFRVELAVLQPDSRLALEFLCEIADCEVGLPAKVALVGIEASDLHPDSEHKGRLVLAATLKSRAPFAQQFPHLELTLTDTADQAVARKVLAPADYLSSTTSIADGMQPNADILIAIGIDSGEIAASGYRLYLFYP